jgi:hypothetical protein
VDDFDKCYKKQNSGFLYSGKDSNKAATHHKKENTFSLGMLVLGEGCAKPGF